MKYEYIKIAPEYTEESVKTAIVDMVNSFTNITITSFNSLKGIISDITFYDFDKSDIKYISSVKKVDKKYVEVMDKYVPTILGLKCTLPNLANILLKDIHYVKETNDVEDIMTSIRKFITKQDHRLDISRSGIEASNKSLALEKRLDELGECFDINKNDDITKFRSLFGNMNTFKSSKETFIEIAILADDKLMYKLSQQYETLLNYADTLNDLHLNENDKALKANIVILLQELEFCANYFSFASEVITLAKRASEIYIKASEEIK